jgi:putative copper export protein
MPGFAALNRFVLVPRAAIREKSSLRDLRFGIGAETLLAATVLVLVGVFGILEPA